MPEWLPGLWSLSPIGGMLGTVALFYWLLSTGRLITKSSHERELGLTSKRGDEWKETAISVRTVNTELLKQNSQLIEGNKIADHFFRSVSPGTIADTLTQPAGGGNVVA